jgi:hypothetical protein
VSEKVNKVLVQDFLEALNDFADKEYLLLKIQFDIAPTLAGIKPASLMTFVNQKRNMYELWDCYKEEVCSVLGIRYYELRRKDHRVIVLFYHDEALASCLSHWKNKKFLLEQGYRDSIKLEENLFELKKRYENNCPHELGVFLGYPIEDVIAFIENSGAPCLLCKYWKVYQDVEKALEIFEAFDKEREKVIQYVLQFQKRSA